MTAYRLVRAFAATGFFCAMLCGFSINGNNYAQAQIVLRSGDHEARTAEALREQERARAEEVRKSAEKQAAVDRQQAEAKARTERQIAQMRAEAAKVRREEKPCPIKGKCVTPN